MGNQPSTTNSTRPATEEPNKMDPTNANANTTAAAAEEHEPNEEDHDFEIIHKDETLPQLDDHHHQQVQQQQPRKQHPGVWMGIDLGTSNCAAAIWDSTRGRPKWMRLQDIAVPQSTKGGKAGRIVPSAVQLCTIAPDTTTSKMNASTSSKFQKYKTPSKETTDIFPLQDDDNLLWKDIQAWNTHNPHATLSKESQSQTKAPIQARVGYTALLQLQQTLLHGLDRDSEEESNGSAQGAQVITSMKRVLGVCDTTKLKDLDPVFRKSLPFVLEERSDGKWVVPCSIPSASPSGDSSNSRNPETTVLYLRPIHVAAILLQAMRQKAQVYLRRTIPKKHMQVPGLAPGSTTATMTIDNVVVGVPAYFGQGQRKAVEEAARLAGFGGHVSTLTESTAAAMAYGLFVAPSSTTNDDKKSILVLDMGGGTTDITIAELNSDTDRPHGQQKENKDETSHFHVILTDGDNRLGGEDMDQALYQLVLQMACSKSSSSNSQALLTQLQDELTAQQRQSLLRSCQQAKEKLCGDVDHGDPPEKSATVQFPDITTLKLPNIEVTQDDLNRAIQPLLERTARLIERALQRYTTKATGGSTVQEVILIGGATRVPALRDMLKDRFFSNLELCVSVNAMSAVAQGTAIQAAILSRQVPLHEVRSAMMLDTTPHAIGVLVPGGNSDGSSRFVEILPRDTPLPAQSYGTFYVGDLDQKGITVAAVESIGDPQWESGGVLYQPLGDFTFLLHRLSDLQRDAIQQDAEHAGLRPVDIGMTLDTNGAFQVSIFDSNDPDHIRKREFYRKIKDTPEAGHLLLDYVVKAATTDWKKEGMTAEEFKLVVTASLLFVFYILVKVLISKEVSEEDMARIL